jgi:hypothetical protein
MPCVRAGPAKTATRVNRVRARGAALALHVESVLAEYGAKRALRT